MWSAFHFFIQKSKIEHVCTNQKLTNVLDRNQLLGQRWILLELLATSHCWLADNCPTLVQHKSFNSNFLYCCLPYFAPATKHQRWFWVVWPMIVQHMFVDWNRVIFLNIISITGYAKICYCFYSWRNMRFYFTRIILVYIWIFYMTSFIFNKVKCFYSSYCRCSIKKNTLVMHRALIIYILNETFACYQV